jgi:hypothetical protein
MVHAECQAEILSEVNGESLFPRYQTVINEIAQLVTANGYELVGFREGTGSRFNELPIQAQPLIIDGLEAFLNLCLSAEKEGAELRGDSHPAAWWVIRKLGWRPLSDVFSNIRSGDTIEIYDKNHVQVFRSFNMFRCISYSLDELVTYDWPLLYEREAWIQDMMLKMGQRLVTEPNVGTILNPFPDHSVTERFSMKRRQAYCTSRLVSPLYDGNGKVSGYMNVLKAEPVVRA